MNKGGLCIKGWSSATLLTHPDRLREPLVRRTDGTFEPAMRRVPPSGIASRALEATLRIADWS